MFQTTIKSLRKVKVEKKDLMNTINNEDVNRVHK